MKRIHFLIPMSALMLAACASAPTPTPTAAPALTPTLELTIEPSFPAFLLAYSSPETLADTPPELTSGFGGEVKGISQADIDYLVAWEVYQKLYREEQGPTVWSEEEFLEKFVPEMLSYLDKKSGIELIVQQDADSGKLLVALVKKSGNTKSVYWDFDGSVLANTNPMSLDADFSDDPGLVHLKPGLSPQFRFNPVDGHWYMFAVDADGEAVEWFATSGATEDNQDKQWEEVEKPEKYYYLAYNAEYESVLKGVVEQSPKLEDVVRMMGENGEPLPFGHLFSYEEGGLNKHVVSGYFGEGWIDPALYVEGMKQNALGGPAMIVPLLDGSQMVISPISLKSTLPDAISFLPGNVAAKPWESEGLDRFLGTNEDVFDFLKTETSEGGKLVGRQFVLILTELPSQAVGYQDYNRNLNELINFFQGKGENIKWTGKQKLLYEIYLIPEIGVRP